MLNYIWAGLIVTSFLFAIGYDGRDIAGDRYRNGQPLPVALAFPQGYDPAARRVPVEIRSTRAVRAFYGRTGPAASMPATCCRPEGAIPLRRRRNCQPLATIARSPAHAMKSCRPAGRFTPPGGPPGSSSSRCGS
jgi:hypothetical protein